jgi:hypothetical protein
MPTPDELRAQAAALEARAVELETPLTADDVHALYTERRYDEIEQARQDGRLSQMFTTPSTEGA